MNCPRCSPMLVGPALGIHPVPGKGRKGFHVTFFSAVLRTNLITDDTPSSLRLHQDCFQLVMGLYNYGDYSLCLFSFLHRLLSNPLRPFIKHGDPSKVSKVLIRHFLKQKKTQSKLMVYCVLSDILLKPCLVQLVLGSKRWRRERDRDPGTYSHSWRTILHSR
jgi:hypothetical protein